LIATAISAASTALTGLGVVDRYGGLCIPVTFTQEVDQGRLTRKVFPVREGVNADTCYNKGKYEDLVPADHYKNLVYWEELAGMAEATPPSSLKLSRSYVYLRGSARMVYWLNLPKMGASNDAYRTIGDQFAWAMIEALRDGFNVASGAFTGTQVRFDSARQNPRDVSIFSKYSYDAETVGKYVLYPYDFGAIDFEVTMIVPRRCVSANALALGAELECVTEW